MMDDLQNKYYYKTCLAKSYHCKTLNTLKVIQTRGLEALTWMLFFKFAIIIIGLCVRIEASKRN